MRIVLILLLLLGGGAGAGWWFFLRDADTTEVAEPEPPPDPVYVDFDPLRVPVIRNGQLDQTITMIIVLQVEGTEQGDRVIANSPRLMDQFLQELYGGLNADTVLDGDVVRVSAIKPLVQRAVDRVMGDGVVQDVLIQAVNQSPAD